MSLTPEIPDREDGRGRYSILGETVGSRGCSVLAGGVRNVDDIDIENRRNGWVACDCICEGKTEKSLGRPPQNFLKKLEDKVGIATKVGREK